MSLQSTRIELPSLGQLNKSPVRKLEFSKSCHSLIPVSYNIIMKPNNLILLAI